MNRKKPPSLIEIYLLTGGASGILATLTVYITIYEKIGFASTFYLIICILSSGFLGYGILRFKHWHAIRRKYLYLIQQEPEYVVLGTKNQIRVDYDSDRITVTKNMVIEEQPNENHKFVDHCYISKGKEMKDIRYYSSDGQVIEMEWANPNNLAVWWIPKKRFDVVPVEYQHSFSWNPGEYNIDENGEMYMTYPSAKTATIQIEVKACVPIEKAVGFISDRRCMDSIAVLYRALSNYGLNAPLEVLSPYHVRWVIKNAKLGCFYYLTWFYKGKVSSFKNIHTKTHWKRLILDKKTKKL